MPKGSSVGALSSGPAATPAMSTRPKAAASKVPATSPSSTDSCPSMPLKTRANSTVKAMVATASPMLAGSPKFAEPGLPAMMPP